MNIELIRDVLGWSVLINFAILIAWFSFFVMGREFMYKMHKKWFNVPKEKFNTINYTLMGIFEILILLLFLAPYLAIRIAT